MIYIYIYNVDETLYIYRVIKKRDPCKLSQNVWYKLVSYKHLTSQIIIRSCTSTGLFCCSFVIMIIWYPIHFQKWLHSSRYFRYMWCIPWLTLCSVCRGMVQLPVVISFSMPSLAPALGVLMTWRFNTGASVAPVLGTATIMRLPQVLANIWAKTVFEFSKEENATSVNYNGTLRFIIFLNELKSIATWTCIGIFIRLAHEKALLLH